MNFGKIAAIACLLCHGLLCAEEESPWEFTGAASLALADGNSDSVAYSLQFLGSYLDEENEAYFGVDYFYADNGAARTTDSLKIFGQYNRDLGTNWYYGGRTSYFVDQIANIDYRIDAGLLIGYRFLDTDTAKLSLEAGPGYAWKDQSGVEREFATFRLGQKFEYKLSDLTTLRQSLSYTPEVSDPGNNVLELEAGIDTRITNEWSLRTFVKHRYDSTPALGRGSSDTSLLLGVAYDLGGLPEPSSGGGRRTLMPGEAAPAEKQNGWETLAAIGVTMATGNSDSLAFDFELNNSYITPEREFFFDLQHSMTESGGATTLDRTSSRIQYNDYFSHHFFQGGKIDFLRDGEAEIDYRVTPGYTLGYVPIRSDSTRLSLETGPAYTFETTGKGYDNYAVWSAAQRLTHKFNDRISLNQSVVCSTQVDDLQNYTVEAKASLDTKISDRLIWRVGFDYFFEGEPAAGRKNQDTRLRSSVAVKF